MLVTKQTQSGLYASLSTGRIVLVDKRPLRRLSLTVVYQSGRLAPPNLKSKYPGMLTNMKPG